MSTTEERLAAALWLVLRDAHRVYGSTATWHGGIGGSAMTTGCAFIDPAPDQLYVEFDLASRPLREWLEQHRDFDVSAAAAALKDELNTEVAALLRPRTEGA